MKGAKGKKRKGRSGEKGESGRLSVEATVPERAASGRTDGRACFAAAPAAPRESPRSGPGGSSSSGNKGAMAADSREEKVSAEKERRAGLGALGGRPNRGRHCELGVGEVGLPRAEPVSSRTRPALSSSVST